MVAAHGNEKTVLSAENWRPKRCEATEDVSEKEIPRHRGISVQTPFAPLALEPVRIEVRGLLPVRRLRGKKVERL